MLIFMTMLPHTPASKKPGRSLAPIYSAVAYVAFAGVLISCSVASSGQEDVYVPYAFQNAHIRIEPDRFTPGDTVLVRMNYLSNVKGTGLIELCGRGNTSARFVALDPEPDTMEYERDFNRCLVRRIYFDSARWQQATWRVVLLHRSMYTFWGSARCDSMWYEPHGGYIPMIDNKLGLPLHVPVVSFREVDANPR